MKELVDDIAYQKLEEKYSELLLDYVLLAADEEYKGEESHKEAVIEAIICMRSRTRVGNRYDFDAFTVEEQKMKCKRIDVDAFFMREIMAGFCRQRRLESSHFPVR